MVIAMYQYILYGMTVLSDIDFPQLVPDNRKQEKTVTIVAGNIPKEKIIVSDRKWEFGEEISWLENSTCYLVVENGYKIVYELKPNADIMKLRTYILGWGMSMAALQRNEMAMHCSVVANERGALLICGESGSGKSTTTAYFLENGYRLMADDMALTECREDGTVWVKPAFPYQKLCEDVAISKGYDLDKLIHIDEIKGKYLVKYPGEFLTTPEKVLGLIYLCKSRDEQVQAEDVVGLNRFYVCINNLFLRHLLQEHKFSPKIGNECLKMASAIPMRMIVRPAEGDTLTEVLNYAWDFANNLE